MSSRPLPLEIRTIYGYAITPYRPESLEIRRVFAYTLTGRATALPLGTSGYDTILSQIYGATDGPLSQTDFTVSDPVESDDVDYNTMISAVAIPTGRYRSFHPFHYKRISIEDGLFGKTLGFNPAGFGTVHGMLSAFNTYTGMRLDVRDVKDNVINGSAVILEALETSYLFIPGTTMLISN